MNTDGDEGEEEWTNFLLRESVGPVRNLPALQLSVSIRVHPWFNFKFFPEPCAA